MQIEVEAFSFSLFSAPRLWMWYKVKCIGKYCWLYDTLFHCHLFFLVTKYDIRFYKLFQLCVLLHIEDTIHYWLMRESKCCLPETNTSILVDVFWGVMIDVTVQINCTSFRIWSAALHLLIFFCAFLITLFWSNLSSVLEP